jgi:hypothetical protein
MTPYELTFDPNGALTHGLVDPTLAYVRGRADIRSR